MPSYNFLNTKTNEEFTEFMSMSEKDVFLKNNTHITQLLSAITIVDPYSVGLKKTDSKFREALAKVKRTNPGNTITTGNLSEV